jgi:ribosomal protein S1
VDGLLHISQMSSRPVAAPQDVVQLGDELTVKVIRIEPNERRIGLSLRDLAADMPIMEEEEHRGRRGGRKRDRDRYDSDDDD